MQTDAPFISIIVPIRNEKDYIERCIQSILGQNYPVGQMEIFIADGMSTDGTREIVQGYIDRYPCIHLVDNPGKIVSVGMNLAMRKCQNTIIIRVDGHCEIDPDYIRHCVDHLQNDRVEGVGGPMETIGETALSDTIAVAMSSLFGVGGTAFRTISDKTMQVDTVPFPAYTREIIEKAGLYDEELVRNQDDEYNYRLREMGAKILLAADVKSRYYSRGSIQKLSKQYFQYGYWKVRVLQKHPRQMSARQFVPPAFAAALIGSGGLAIFSPVGRLLLAMVAGSYLLANLAASLLTARRRGWKHLPRLPLVFAILHLSYGCGFLTGLVKFANRWGDKVGKVPPFESVHASD